MQAPPNPGYPGQPAYGGPPSQRTDDSSKIVKIIIIVVAVAMGLPVVLGILAAVAIPSFIRYIREAKTAEAEMNLQALASDVEGYCRSNGGLPGRAGPVPPAPSVEQQLGSFEADAVFAELGFAPAEPVYFSYEIQPEGPEQLRLVARGNLDGDSVESERSLTCRLAGCMCDDEIEELNPME